MRQSQLDAFLAAGESGRLPAQPNPWQPVSEAVSAVMAAVGAQDRGALDHALPRLADAAQEIRVQNEGSNSEPRPAAN